MRAKVWMAVTAITFMLLTSGSARAADWKEALEDSLKAKYDLAKIGLDRVRITKPGTVFVIQKQGIAGDLATDATYSNNKVVDGQVSQPGGFGAFMQGKETSRTFKSGEKVYVWKLDVKDDAVVFFLISCESFDVNVKGSSKVTRYKSLLAFPFPKGFLETADADVVKKVVDAVIIPEGEAQAASPKTVELGQTPAQVEAALGPPQKIINLGAKKVYVYTDMKVVFVDDKVSDVQ